MTRTHRARGERESRARDGAAQVVVRVAADASLFRASINRSYLPDSARLHVYSAIKTARLLEP